MARPEAQSNPCRRMLRPRKVLRWVKDLAGDTLEDLLVDFPDLERDDLRACLEYAAQSLKLKSQHLALA
jgi:uncharacterized protein (DUF433 family)